MVKDPVSLCILRPCDLVTLLNFRAHISQKNCRQNRTRATPQGPKYLTKAHF